MSQYLSSESDERKGRTWALIGTLLFHGMLVILLFWLALRTPLPLPGEEGVEVNLGSSDDGMGDIQPEEAALLKSTATPSQASSAEDEMITEDTEEAPALEKTNKKSVKQNTATTKPAREPEPVKQPQVNTKALFKGKSDKNTQGGSQGITGKPGDQGKETGTPDGAGYTGLGGKGSGISYDLGGRGAKNLPKPAYNSDEQGFIVVTIFVNKEGRVTRARAGAKGTTISDQQLWTQAENAALRAVFTANPEAAEEQKGTIKYTFLKSR